MINLNNRKVVDINSEVGLCVVRRETEKESGGMRRCMSSTNRITAVADQDRQVADQCYVVTVRCTRVTNQCGGFDDPDRLSRYDRNARSLPLRHLIPQDRSGATAYEHGLRLYGFLRETMECWVRAAASYISSVIGV